MARDNYRLNYPFKQPMFVPMIIGLTLITTIISVNYQVVVAREEVPTNLLDNGSFENINGFNYQPNFDLHNDEILGADPPGTPSPNGPPNAIADWLITNGTIDWANRRWQRASDCSAMCIDISGSNPGTMKTSFSAKPKMSYTVILDTSPNFDAPAPGLAGSFNITFLILNISNFSSSSTNYSSSDDGGNLTKADDIVVSNTMISVDGVHNPGWHTHSFVFSTPHYFNASAGNITLVLSSNTAGYWGPLIDNIRVYEGLFQAAIPADKIVTCPDDLPKDQRLKIVLISISCFLALVLSIATFLLTKQLRNKARDKKATSHLQGRLRIFSYNTLKSVTRNFHESLKLGQGTFGAVYKGTMADGDEVAIKKLFAVTPQGQKSFLNEALVISNVQHRNLVKLRGCCVKGFQTFLIYEYVENRSLDQVLWSEARKSLKWQVRFKIILGTARGLAYLHEACQPRIIHCDIKAGNILLDKTYEAKLADFGLAKILPDDKTHISTQIGGTLGYLAPEYAMRGQLSEKADVFSYGILVFELVSGRKNLNYKLSTERQYILDWARNLSNQGKLEELIDAELYYDYSIREEIISVIEVALSCTQELSIMRPSMSEVIEMLQGISKHAEKQWEETPDNYAKSQSSKSWTGLVKDEKALSHLGVSLLDTENTMSSLSLSSSFQNPASIEYDSPL